MRVGEGEAKGGPTGGALPMWLWGALPARLWVLLVTAMVLVGVGGGDSDGNDHMLSP